jgi:hypothetical protein
MSDILHITEVAPILSGVLKLKWDDGYEGVVDLRPIIADGEIFEPLRDPERFRSVRVAEFGHSIFWLDDEGDEVDFGCDRLREIAERQAALLQLAG